VAATLMVGEWEMSIGRSGGDIGMVERGERLGLALEPRHPFRVARERVRQHLDRDVTLQPRVACTIHLAHSARAEQGNDVVGAEARAGAQGHLTTISATPDKDSVRCI
jgi:hypothetical protein